MPESIYFIQSWSESTSILPVAHLNYFYWYTIANTTALHDDLAPSVFQKLSGLQMTPCLLHWGCKRSSGSDRHTYEFLSTFKASELDRYKILNLRLRCSLEQLPNNSCLNSLRIRIWLSHSVEKAYTIPWHFCGPETENPFTDA